jgi:YD repeat-containing protein
MKKMLLAATVLTLTFASCKKDNNGPNPGPSPIDPSAKLLTKITKTEGGRTTVYNVSYDANKRLTSIATANNSEYQKFTYDAAGNVIKAEELNDEFKNFFTYTYNNNLPVSGTFKSYRITAGEPDDLIEDDIMTYTVANNLVTKIKLNLTQMGIEVDFDVKYKNGNVNVIESTHPQFKYHAQFDFGTKKSAIPTVYRFVMDHAGFSANFMGKNELTAYLFDFGGTIPGFGKQSQYTYDTAGYPLTANDGTTTLKFEYQ